MKRISLPLAKAFYKLMQEKGQVSADQLKHFLHDHDAVYTIITLRNLCTKHNYTWDPGKRLCRGKAHGQA